MFGHRYYGAQYFATRYFGEGGEGAPPAVEGGYFGRRYFAGRYFGPRYFGIGETGTGPPPGAGGYFGHRYFGARYFAPRYFGTQPTTAPPVPEPVPPSGGAGRGTRGARRRWYPYANILDDPELFIRPQPEPEPEPELEPVEAAAPREPSALADLAPPVRPPRRSRLVVEAPAELAPPIEAPNEEEEEMLVLRLFGFLS